MKMERLKGSIDRIENGVVVVVEKNTGSEIFLDEKEIELPQEGLKVDLLISRADDPCGVSGVISSKKVIKPKRMKMKNFSSLIRAMAKVKDRLDATLEEENSENCDFENIDDLKEKIEFLERGIELFS